LRRLSSGTHNTRISPTIAAIPACGPGRSASHLAAIEAAGGPPERFRRFPAHTIGVTALGDVVGSSRPALAEHGHSLAELRLRP